MAPNRSRIRRKVEDYAARATWRSLPRTSLLIAEFPRSGGTWIAKVLGSALDLPVPQQSVLPIWMPVVQHGHRLPHQARPGAQTCLVVRDGRDVYLSLLFHMKSLDATSKMRSKAPSEVSQFFKSGDSNPDVATVLPAFLEWQFASPRYAQLHWADYNSKWLSECKDRVVIVRYEDYVEDTHAALGATLDSLGRSVSERIQSLAVARYDFETVSGRKPGDVDPTSFLRSGTAGTWRSSYNADAAEVFWATCGDVAAELGYERLDTSDDHDQ